MSLSQSEFSGGNNNYKIISRWLHKTLSDWRVAFKSNGSNVLIYEEYIDSTTNARYFLNFIVLLNQHCPNLTHVRLIFSGEKSDTFDNGFVKYLFSLRNLQCLTLIDVPDTEFFELKNESNQVTTLNLVGVDESVTTSDFSNILNSIKNLHSLVYQYKGVNDKRFVAAISNLTQLKALTLHYPSESELKQLKDCNQIETLHLYNVYEKLNSDDFLNIFKEKRNLHTLSICVLEQNLHIPTEIHKLNAYCPQLTYLTINKIIKNVGDFKNLKYLRFDMDNEIYLPIFKTEKIVAALSDKYADRLQILDLSKNHYHTHTTEIYTLKSLKAFLCSSWPKDMYHCLSEFADLQFLSFERFPENLVDNETLNEMILTSRNLKYLRLPLKANQIEEFTLSLPDVLHKRGVQPDNPFVLSLAANDTISDIENKVKTCANGNLLQLDWNCKIFESKLQELIVCLHPSALDYDKAVKNIFKNPVKVAGDCFGPEEWLSNMNYKIALKSCSNKYNLEYDEEMVSRCRNFSISNADYELSNMKFAFNFKYDALDEYNEHVD